MTENIRPWARKCAKTFLLFFLFALSMIFPASILACDANPFIGESHIFEAQTTDPDGDNISYIFDWGDGGATETPFVASGIAETSPYAWIAAGIYSVKVVAKDTPGGALSPDSNTLEVCVGKQGDVNLNGVVDVADAMKCVQVILGNNTNPDEVDRCDVNRDSNGYRDVADVMKIVNIILTQP